MAIVVPTTDVVNYPKYAECVALLATVSATSSSPHKVAAQDRLKQAYAELITSLMHGGKLSPVNLFAAGTYGT